MHEAQSLVSEVIMIIVVCSQVTCVLRAHQCGQLFSSATGRQRGNAYRAMKGSPPLHPETFPLVTVTEGECFLFTQKSVQSATRSSV